MLFTNKTFEEKKTFDDKYLGKLETTAGLKIESNIEEYHNAKKYKLVISSMNVPCR